ncbi:MAG: hypothetical protein GY944_14115 [bacterium]|nr:hypothetical protein [bacterium]
MRSSRWYRTRRFACAALLLSLYALPAAAVILDKVDGTGNTTSPPDDPGWDNVGIVNSLTGVYLRNGWVLTAEHVGIGDILLDGTTYTAVAGSEIQLDDGAGTLADLVLFSITPVPTLPDLDVRTNPSLPSGEVTMAGRGRNRGAASDSDDPGIWDSGVGTPPVPAVEGWYWGGIGSLRWGTNIVEGDWTFSATDTVSFYTVFDEPTADNHTPDECQAAAGDSGGALFAKQGANWELAGIIWAVAGYTGQIGNTSALRENATLVADLSFYAADINTITATVPEPTVVLQLAIGAGVVAALKRTRTRGRS